MKIPFVLLSTVLLSALVVTGCGKKEAAGPAAGASAPAASAATPAAPRAIEITAGDNMKFNLATIEASAGENLKITLTNIGTLPKEAMGHNWVLLKKGADATAFSMAAMTAKDTDYIPAALKDQVLAHTETIGPRKSSEVAFKAPTEPGEYTFLCSFPAHFSAGMKGVLVVK
ncbi:MAG TPA: azurin [Opitutaceae bacterium]|nr:azurin [Opitutaceae bacterium]